MTTQYQCPHCGHLEVSRAAFRVDPSTGKRVKQPPSMVWVLSLTIPIGAVSAWMFFNYGPGSGCGLWLLGMTLAIATPIYIWGQHQAYRQLPERPNEVCARCGRPV